MEPGPFLVVERGKYAWFGRVEHPLDSLQQVTSARREDQDLAAAVTFVPFAQDQSLRLEAVDEGHDVTAVDAQAQGDVFLAGRPVLLQAAQDGVLMLAQPGRGKLAGALLADQGGQLDEHEAGAVAQGGREQPLRGGHADQASRYLWTCH